MLIMNSVKTLGLEIQKLANIRPSYRNLTGI